MASLVVLSNTNVDLTLDALRQSLDSLYPGEFLPPREQGSFVVDSPEQGATFLIKSNVAGASGLFMLHSGPGPYTEFSNFAERIADLALLKTVQSQSCWLSVDRVGSGSDEEAYRFIGNVLALLAPEDTAVLVHPSKLIAIKFNADIRRHLAVRGAAFAEA